MSIYAVRCPDCGAPPGRECRDHLRGWCGPRAELAVSRQSALRDTQALRLECIASELAAMRRDLPEAVEDLREAERALLRARESIWDLCRFGPLKHPEGPA